MGDDGDKNSEGGREVSNSRCILVVESTLFAVGLKESDKGIKEIIYDYCGFSLP